MTYVPIRGESSVVIDGTPYGLVIDNAAFLAMEQASGQSFLSLVSEVLDAEATGQPARLGTMQSMLWGALRDQHEDIGQAQCGDMILLNSVRLRLALVEALAGAMPTAAADYDAGEAEAPTSPAPKSRGTGSTRKSAGSKPEAT